MRKVIVVRYANFCLEKVSGFCVLKVFVNFV